MMLTVDPHSGVPAYRQLVDQIRFHVASGLLKPGDEIPSTRSLSSLLGINPMTISRAYALLEQDGVLERRPGLPLIVRAQLQSSVRAGRLDQLRRVLRPAASAARQLGVTGKDAGEILRRLVDDESR